MTTYFLLGNPLVSEDSIMGREDGGTFSYTDDLHGQRKKGKGKNGKLYEALEKQLTQGSNKSIKVNKESKGKIQQSNMVTYGKI